MKSSRINCDEVREILRRVAITLVNKRQGVLAETELIASIFDYVKVRGIGDHRFVAREMMQWLRERMAFSDMSLRGNIDL